MAFNLHISFGATSEEEERIITREKLFEAFVHQNLPEAVKATRDLGITSLHSEWERSNQPETEAGRAFEKAVLEIVDREVRKKHPIFDHATREEVLGSFRTKVKVAVADLASKDNAPGAEVP